MGFYNQLGYFGTMCMQYYEICMDPYYVHENGPKYYLS